MAEKWLTVQQAVAHYSKSERSIRRWCREGRFQTRHEKGRLLILVPDFEPGAEQAQAEINALLARIDQLELDNEAKKALIEQLSGERDYLRQAHMASLAQIQLLVEGQSEAKGEAKKRKWWQFGGD